MSHCIIEVPKEPPLEGCWVFLVAKNWIYEDVLYTPDNSYSPAYKLSLLVNGKNPDIVAWERTHSFKVIHEFDSYQQARLNLPRAEKGLPLITSKTEVGRGYRQRIAKSRKLPGELSTTEPDESEQEEANLTPTNKSTLNKKSTPVKRKSSSETTKLPLPPPTLRSKSKNVTSNSSQQISQSTTKMKPSVTNAIAGPSGLSGMKRNRCDVVNNVKSCSTVQLFQKSNSRQEKLNDDDIQNSNSEVCGMDTQEEASLTQTKKRKLKNKSIRGQRTSSSETTRLPLTPSTSPTSYANIPSIRTALAGPSGQSEKEKERCDVNQHQLNDDDNLSDSSEEGFPRNIHDDTNDMLSITPYLNDSQFMSTPYTPRPTPSPSPHDSFSISRHSGTSKKNVAKGGEVAKVVLMTLAQMNETLSVLEKSMAKPVAEVSEDEGDDDLSFLPVKSLADFEKFEKHLKQNKDVIRKLVSMITRLGKRNTKNSEGDYVRRAWECVIAHSAAKDLNWLGRPDKRVNNGLGKRGIKESIITKAILKGITNNKDFKEMQGSTFESETKTFLKNSKATYNRKANAQENNAEDDDIPDDYFN